MLLPSHTVCLHMEELDEADTGDVVGVICTNPEGEAGAVLDFFRASKKYGDSSNVIGAFKLVLKDGNNRSSKDLFLLA